ncbi:MAG: DUF1566 domain-containing protein [Gammaproteobacteria bacterium]|nr:DUF1566 domain-containing protein [Gammaproteobacteria bacterium]
MNMHMNATPEPMIAARRQPRSPKKGDARIHHRGLLCLVLAVSLHANAALETINYLGDTVVKDTDSGLMWLQDANLSNTTMNWTDAKDWAEALDYAGYTDWRLPSAGLLNPDDPGSAYDGSADSGYNITRARAELAHLYNGVLGNSSKYNADGSESGTWSWPGNNGPFVDVVSTYWLAEEFAPDTTLAWHFYATNGVQDASLKAAGNLVGAWAVRDVAAVPLPGALTLFGTALVGLLGFRAAATSFVIR